MRQLLNTLFVTSEDIYLSLDGENVVASREHNHVNIFIVNTMQIRIGLYKFYILDRGFIH